jgi:UDP-2,3-diacylglucosamine pyrophosphatase LpxH
MDGVAFPYWGERFGWRAVGARSDRLAGRQVMTVFYEEARGRRVGYAIVAGSAPAIHGGTVSMRQGTPFRVISNAAATEVAWLRHGHLCIVSGRGVSPTTLLALASWKEDSNSA